MSEQKPVAKPYAYACVIKEDGSGYGGVTFTLAEDEPIPNEAWLHLFTADQLKAEREKAIRECADLAENMMIPPTLEGAAIGNKIRALLSTNESKE
jgi:hypothetical protein